jgi:hypothetical protein
MKALRPLTPGRLAIAEQRLRDPLPGSPIEAARDTGVDLTLLIEKLRLTPSERVRRMHDVSLAAEQVRGARLGAGADELHQGRSPAGGRGRGIRHYRGWCAILHGSSFITNDLDICCSGKPDNLRRLAKAMAPLHPKPRDFRVGLPFIGDEVTFRNGAVFTLTTDLGSIDLLAQVSGVGDFDQVRANSLEVHAFDRTVWTLDLPALIRAKRSAGREKDLRLLPELESLLDAED